MPEPGAYFTYRELFDRLPTKDELSSIVRSLDPVNAVVLTARLNAMFRHATWSQHPQDAKAMEKFQYWFASAFLDLDTKQRLESRFGDQNPARRPVFHPLQFLNLMRLALDQAEGDETARPDTSESHRYGFGTACLMISDLLLSPEEQQNLKSGTLDDRRKQLMLQWLASYELSNPTPRRNLLFRSYATYRIVLSDPDLLARIRNECEGLDIERDFAANCGLPLMGWLSLVFGVQSLLLVRTQQDLLNEPAAFIVNRKLLLENPTLTPEQIGSFFDMLSMTFDELRSEIRKERPVDERFDLVPFKSKPFFVTVPENYVCTDFGLFAEKIHNGPYFLLSNKMPEKERGRMFKAWGMLFEAYVNWLLKGLNGRHSAKLYPDTVWEDGNKSFDAVIVKSRIVVVIECKGGFLRQDARYSNNLETFMAELQNKIGGGCKQLARDIASLFPESGNSKQLRNVQIPPNPIWVLPVLVVQDLMLRTPFVNYFLNQRFQAEMVNFPVKKRLEVLPLNLIQITHLEDLVEMTEAFNLDAINVLHCRCTTNREMLWELPDVLGAIPDDKRAVSARFKDILDKSMTEMCSLLFKESSV